MDVKKLEGLTAVKIMAVPKMVNWFLGFGKPFKMVHEHTGAKAGSRLMTAYFRRGQVFGYSQQSLNEYGVISWNFYALRAIAAGEQASRIAGVIPAAECLFQLRGKKEVACLRPYLTALSDAKLEPEMVADLHRIVGPYLAVGIVPENEIAEFARGLK